MADPALAGSLSVFRLPEILTFLERSQKSGALTVTTDRKEAYVYFDSGVLIYAGSNQEQFRLSSVLLRKKKISRGQHERIEELMQRDGGRFGALAVQERLLTDAELRDFLKIQVSEILFDAFVWRGGQFSFVDQLSLPDFAVTISIDLSNLIMEGARRIDEWEQCAHLLPDPTVVFRIVAHPAEDKITLSVEEWKILFLINGARTLEELWHDAQDEPFHVYRVIYGLLSNKLIEVVSAQPSDEHTDSRPALSGDATFRQSPQFHADSTVREQPDDTNLLVSSDARFAYKDVVRTTVAQLTIVTGDETGKVFPLVEPEYLLGRQRDNNIQLPDLGISGFHARIFRGSEGFILEDLKSRNGTWLNSARIVQAVINDGDTIRLGATEMLYKILY